MSDLASFVERNAPALQALLGPLWPVNPEKVEQFGGLTKYTLGPMPNGQNAMLHFIAGPDGDLGPHDHPTNFESHVIEGSYLERIYLPERGTKDVARVAGASHLIGDDCIHDILSVSAGGCWTLCFGGAVVRDWKHYPQLRQREFGRPETA